MNAPAAAAPRPTFRRLALLCMAGLLLLGFASGWLSNSGYDNGWFRLLDKPAAMPPAWAFPVAWSLLYLAQGLALALVLGSPPGPARRRAILLFAAQFALNLLWSPLFFAAHQVTAAFWLIVAMLGLAILATFAMARVRGLAAWLMVPYLVWLSFAAVLNLRVDQLNPSAERVALT